METPNMIDHFAQFGGLLKIGQNRDVSSASRPAKEPGRQMFERMDFLFSATAIVSLLILMSFFGEFHPAFDSIAHFRAHLAALLGLLAVLLVFRGDWLQALAAAVFTVTAFTTVQDAFPLPGLTSVRAASEPPDEPRAVYRLLHMNLLYDNPTPSKVLSLIGRTKPDVITLNEVTPRWVLYFDQIAAAYPYRVVCEGTSHVGGVAVLSRRPLDKEDAGRCFVGGTLATAFVNFGGRTVEVAALHLDWPWPYSQPHLIEHLRDPLGQLAETVLVAGDLNAVGWSAAVHRVARSGGLTAIASIGPTWLHRALPKGLRRWIGLPIDHAFFKGDVVVHSATVLEDAGSDHLPILVEFSIPQLAPPADRERPTATAFASL
jgi:endonuclease/exonuclease/phosphatase (EEP) superfamily protein YafD